MSLTKKYAGAEPQHSARGFFEDGYQQWQLVQLGHLLDIYQRASGISIRKLVDDIEVLTEQTIGSEETVRRIIKISTKTNGNYIQKEPDLYRYEIAASFLVHSAIGLLNLDHLRFRNFPTTAPIAFIHSLQFNFDEQLPCLHPSYGGSYRTNGSETNETQRISISINEDKDWFVVRLVRGAFNLKKSVKRTDTYDGWGVMLPENLLLIHLKHTQLGRNILLSTPICPLDFSSPRQKVVELVLSDISDPLEIDGKTPEISVEKNQKLLDNINIFQYVNSNFFDDESISGIIEESGEEPASKWDRSLRNNPALKNSRFFDQQKASERAKDNAGDKSMEKKERYLGQRFIKAVQDISHSKEQLFAILDDGQTLNAQDPFNGCTALHYAIGGQDKSTALWLVDFPSIDLTIQDKRGRTPAMLAAIILAEEGSSSLLDDDFVETLRTKEIEQIQTHMAKNDPSLPPAFQSQSIDND